MVSEIAKGKTLEEVAALKEAFVKTLAPGADSSPPPLGDLRALVGVRQFPSRVRCAMLAFEALEAAIGK